jgi:hypothetical protein
MLSINKHYYNDYVLAGTDLAISTQGGHPIPEDLW